jgi:hypothetical protein
VEPPAIMSASKKVSGPAVGFVLANNVFAAVAVRPCHLFTKAQQKRIHSWPELKLF